MSGRVSRPLRRGVPDFSLYGEPSAAERRTTPLHIEDIPSRSRKYLWRIGNHRHAALGQCVFVTEGPVAVDIEGAKATAVGPVVFIIPPGAVHGFKFGADTNGYVLTVSLERLLGMTGAVHQAPITQLFAVPRSLALAADAPFAGRTGALLGMLLGEFLQPDTQEPVIVWLACAVLWMLAGRALTSPPVGAWGPLDVERLQRFRVLIEANYLKHWPVTRYARKLGLSESSLNRLCRGLAGATAFEVIQQRLALEARRRLIFVAGPVSAIAAELGFKDPAYFCRFFRKHCGVSPAAFRRRKSDG